MIYCHLSELQQRLYKRYAEIAGQPQNKADWLQHRHTLSAIIAGPSCLRQKINEKKKGSEEGSEKRERKESKNLSVQWAETILKEYVSKGT